MAANSAIKWSDPVVGCTTEKSCPGLVQDSHGAVKNPVGEG